MKKNDYSKLTKKQLIELLGHVESKLERCFEYAEQKADEFVLSQNQLEIEKYGHPVSSNNKYPYMCGVFGGEINMLLKDMAEACVL